MSERRKRLHDLLLTLINKDSEFEFIEEDSSDLTSSYSEKTPDKDNLNGLFLSKFLINSSRSNSAAACLPSFAHSTLSNVLSSKNHCFLPDSTLKSVG